MAEKVQAIVHEKHHVGGLFAIKNLFCMSLALWSFDLPNLRTIVEMRLILLVYRSKTGRMTEVEGPSHID